MSKQLYKDLGLPTYPINGGMALGMREQEEIHWLLDHGVIQNDLYKITKISKHEYRLTEHRTEETLSSATTWQTLVEMEHLDLASWRWFLTNTPETQTVMGTRHIKDYIDTED